MMEKNVNVTNAADLTKDIPDAFTAWREANEKERQPLAHFLDSDFVYESASRLLQGDIFWNDDRLRLAFVTYLPGNIARYSEAEIWALSKIAVYDADDPSVDAIHLVEQIVALHEAGCPWSDKELAFINQIDHFA